jgi:hypothetical protein
MDAIVVVVVIRSKNTFRRLPFIDLPMSLSIAGNNLFFVGLRAKQ